MRSLGCVLPLRGQGSVQLADPRRVADFGIDVDLIVSEPRRQDSQNTSHQPPIVSWEVNAVEQVGTVPAVGDDGLRPSLRLQERRDLERLLFGQGLLGVGRGDGSNSLRITIDQQPASPGDVAVFGCSTVPIRRKWIEQEVDPLGPLAESLGIAGHQG